MSEATRRSYDAIAARYAREIGDELPGKPADLALLDQAAAAGFGGIIADVGCGPGQVSSYLVNRGARVVALDLSPAMCAIARGSAPALVADMTALPLRAGALSGLVCLYAVIHLDAARRSAAYAEFARVLAPGAQALIAFHTSEAGVVPGAAVELTEWWDEPVELTFHYLDPDGEVALMAAAGLELVARLDRPPYAGVEHESRRSYLTVARRG
jgi:SAM-dependent methyltransferase